MVRRSLLFVAAAVSLAVFSAQASAPLESPKPLKGQTEPAARVHVPAEMRGVLLSVDVIQGQRVKKGDKLAQLKDAVQRQVVAKAKMDADFTIKIRQAQNQFDAAKVESELAKQARVTPIEIRMKELAANQAELLIEHYQDEQKKAELHLVLEQIILEDMTIKSPIDGFVLRVNKHAGEMTDENPLVVVVQVDKLHAIFYPKAEQFGRVKVGDKVELEFDTEPAIKRQASVIAVDPIIDPAGQMFQVKMEIDNNDAKIPAGTTAWWRLR